LMTIWFTSSDIAFLVLFCDHDMFHTAPVSVLSHRTDAPQILGGLLHSLDFLQEPYDPR
jgi:hypothetical protein